eukprot:scaffold18731_cov96-Isochrysis_galbana.AAC.3
MAFPTSDSRAEGSGGGGGRISRTSISSEGRHGRAAALCASDGERACAATEAVVERKGGSVENRILRLDSLARDCLALLNLYASVIP